MLADSPLLLLNLPLAFLTALYLPASLIFVQPNDKFTSFLGAPIYYSDQIAVTGSIEPAKGLVSSLTNITSWVIPQIPARSVTEVPNLVIVIVNRLLYPADIDLLFDGVVQDNSYTFGTNPPYPSVTNSK